MARSPHLVTELSFLTSPGSTDRRDYARAAENLEIRLKRQLQSQHRELKISSICRKKSSIWITFKNQNMPGKKLNMNAFKKLPAYRKSSEKHSLFKYLLHKLVIYNP